MKQIEKVPNPDAISLDDIDTTSKWRVETEDPVMDEALEWLEGEEDDDADLWEEGVEEDDDADLLEEEWEEEDVDVPLPEDDYEDIEEEVDTHLQRRPTPMPPPPQSHTVGTGRRQLTFTSPSSTTSTRAVGGSSSTPGSSRPLPRPPTAFRGRVVPFTHKKGRLIRGSSSGS